MNSIFNIVSKKSPNPKTCQVTLGQSPCWILVDTLSFLKSKFLCQDLYFLENDSGFLKQKMNLTEGDSALTTQAYKQEQGSSGVKALGI